MDTERFSYDQISEHYDKDHFGLQAGCHRVGLEQLRGAGFDIGCALEIGCGTGNFLLLLRAAFPGAQLSGLDPSEKMLQIAAGKLAADYHHGTVESASYETPFDLIALQFVLAYESLEKLLDFADRHLAPDGGLLIGTTTMENFPGTFQRCDFLDFGLLATMIETPTTIDELLGRLAAHGAFQVADHQRQVRQLSFDSPEPLRDFIFNSGWASDISLTFRDEFEALISQADYPYTDLFLSHSILLRRK